MMFFSQLHQQSHLNSGNSKKIQQRKRQQTAAHSRIHILSDNSVDLLIRRWGDSVLFFFRACPDNGIFFPDSLCTVFSFETTDNKMSSRLFMYIINVHNIDSSPHECSGNRDYSSRRLGGQPCLIFSTDFRGQLYRKRCSHAHRTFFGNITCGFTQRFFKEYS